MDNLIFIHDGNGYSVYIKTEPNKLGLVSYPHQYFYEASFKDIEKAEKYCGGNNNSK
jgi:hypothetical protein